MATDSQSRILWRGRSWQLRIIQDTLQDGRQVERGIIEHPGSVVIVPMLDGQVMMLSQYRLALNRSILELPAGTRKQDENWLTCAQRELREETGYRASSWLDLGKIWPAPGITDELMTIFLASDLEWDPLPADEDEKIKLIPMFFDDVASMALDGRLMDAKSIIAIQRAQNRLQK